MTFYFDSDHPSSVAEPSTTESEDECGRSDQENGGFDDSSRTFRSVDGWSAVEPIQIGRYQIIRRLAGGGFGLVYLAHDPELLRNVAVKVPRPDRPLDSNGIERFLTEGKLLARVDHPSVVGVHDLGTTPDGVPYVVMQYVEGKTLRNALKSNSMPVSRWLEILMDIAYALAEAHRQRIVHRDLKPSNVIIDENGDVHLVDFGMALHDELTSHESNQPTPIGTPPYMAPEQVRGENDRIDQRTDIWAFGVTMYRVLSGRLPFAGESRRELAHRILECEPQTLTSVRSGITDELRDVCMRCLPKSMEARYQSMIELIQDLEPAVESALAAQANLSGAESSDVPAKSEIAVGTTPSCAVAPTGDSMQIDTPYLFKGLQPYEAEDHECFIRLLPGPTDQFGMPESIRFWESRLRKLNRVDDLPLGVVLGPPGCGKSSFIRAGLIPGLPGDLSPVYVDCQGTDPSRLIMQHLERIPGISAGDDDLPTVLLRLKQGEYQEVRQKVILILDHFEHWLSGIVKEKLATLRNALKHCDCETIQCLLVVGDDHWVNVSRFVLETGKRIEIGRNAINLPLIDRRHATRTVTEYGHTLGVLDPGRKTIGNSEARFIRMVVDSISENGTVLAIQLAILLDLVSTIRWTPACYRRSIGRRGVILTYLNRELDGGRFPECPEFPTIAHLVLSELVPSTEMDETNRVLSQSLNIAGMLNGRFDSGTIAKGVDLLERELRLIRRVERDEPGHESASCVRLARDSLVKPLQTWLRHRRSAPRGSRKVPRLGNFFRRTGGGNS